MDVADAATALTLVISLLAVPLAWALLSGLRAVAAGAGRRARGAALPRRGLLRAGRLQGDTPGAVPAGVRGGAARGPARALARPRRGRAGSPSSAAGFLYNYSYVGFVWPVAVLGGGARAGGRCCAARGRGRSPPRGRRIGQLRGSPGAAARRRGRGGSGRRAHPARAGAHALVLPHGGRLALGDGRHRRHQPRQPAGPDLSAHRAGHLASRRLPLLLPRPAQRLPGGPGGRGGRGRRGSRPPSGGAGART